MFNRNLKTAKNLARLGFNVFPSIGYGNKYKNPVQGINWGLQATSSLSTIEMWWREYPYSIPSISLKNSSYFVLDADVKNNLNGIANLEKLFAKNNTNLNCYAQTYTPSGGRHYYFKLPSSTYIIRSTNSNMPANIDVKGNNSCIISRSCITKEGLEYKIGMNGNIKITNTPIAPNWLIELLVKPKQNEYKPIIINNELLNNTRYNKYLSVILENALYELSKTQQGNRNNELNRISYKLSALVNVNFISYNKLIEMICNVALNLGLEKSEAKQTITSAIKRGKTNGLIIKDLTNENYMLSIKHKGKIIC